jgi:ribonuclease Z
MAALTRSSAPPLPARCYKWPDCGAKFHRHASNPHPRLLNGRTGDPGVYVEALHLRETILLDCGDLSALTPRHLLRVAVLAVPHAHMGHWAGFDRFLRLLIGRDKRLAIIGPEGFTQCLFHRLQAYT